MNCSHFKITSVGLAMNRVARCLHQKINVKWISETTLFPLPFSSSPLYLLMLFASLIAVAWIWSSLAFYRLPTKMHILHEFPKLSQFLNSRTICRSHIHFDPVATIARKEVWKLLNEVPPILWVLKNKQILLAPIPYETVFRDVLIDSQLSFQPTFSLLEICFKEICTGLQETFPRARWMIGL